MSILRRDCPNPKCRGGKVALTKTTKKKGWETVDRKVVVRVTCPICHGKTYIL